MIILYSMFDGFTSKGAFVTMTVFAERRCATWENEVRWSQGHETLELCLSCVKFWVMPWLFTKVIF